MPGLQLMFPKAPIHPSGSVRTGPGGRSPEPAARWVRATRKQHGDRPAGVCSAEGSATDRNDQVAQKDARTRRHSQV
ncbi:hypothetical protein EYF80_066677 [Liparis tanakae]|uniref:Uncharacterized protein n=1 Tax=Liparis tanakae TaxID=230148 RepID=A0A4Z2E349_9TELE|nr:hypothetical protein EYF80_066677 [Liparis tanakae]